MQNVHRNTSQELFFERRIHVMISCQKYNIFATKWNEREKVILIKISIIHLGKR